MTKAEDKAPAETAPQEAPEEAPKAVLDKDEAQGAEEAPAATEAPQELGPDMEPYRVQEDHHLVEDLRAGPDLNFFVMVYPDEGAPKATPCPNLPRAMDVYAPAKRGGQKAEIWQRILGGPVV